MLSVVYLLTSKWHDVDQVLVWFLGLLDVVIIFALLGLFN